VEQVTRSNTGTGLGIAGLVLGLLSIPLGIIGCTFIMGLVLGIMGITLSAVGLSQSRKANSPSGLILAGLIVSIIGTSFAMIRFSGVVNHTRDKAMMWKEKIEKSEDVQKSIEDNINDAFNNNLDDKNVEEMQKTLEELEKEINKTSDETQRQIDSAMRRLDEVSRKVSKDQNKDHK